MSTFLKRYQIVIFFILAFVISWIPWFTGESGFYPVGVSIAGLMVAVLAGGKAALYDMIRRLFRWRVGLRWYLFALLAPAAIVLTTVGLHVLLGGEAPGFSVLHKPQLMLLFALGLLWIGSGPVGEEIFGWRGYAQTRLQSKLGPVWTSALIGVLWGFWHLPEFFRVGSSQYALGSMGLPLLMLMEIGHSLIITYVYNKTGGSTLVGGVLVHYAFDLSFAYFFTDCTLTGGADFCTPIPSQLIILATVIISLFAAGLVLSTRGRLGLSTAGTGSNAAAREPEFQKKTA
jgi:membrane protease YdiL (CAAX protease family)